MADHPPNARMERIESAASTVEQSANQISPLVKALLALVTLVLLGVALVGYQNQRTSETIDEVDTQVVSLRAENVQLRTQVDELNRFVEELETETPEETSRSEAINTAVAQVPAIREILCDPDAFGFVRGCQVQP